MVTQKRDKNNRLSPIVMTALSHGLERVQKEAKKRSGSYFELIFYFRKSSYRRYLHSSIDWKTSRKYEQPRVLATFSYGGPCQYLGPEILQKKSYLRPVNYSLRKIQYLGSENCSL